MTETIEAGAFEFFLENRGNREDGDGGPSLQILSIIDGEKVQLLRFDMFRISPHYHYEPYGKNLCYSLDPLTLDDSIGWVIGLIRTKFPQLLAKAGHEGLATSADLAAVNVALPNVEQRWRAIC